MVLYLLRRFIMKAVQFIFCFLALFCVAAAVMVGLLGEYLYAIIPLAAAVVFGVLLLLTARKKKPTHPESSETPQDNSSENWTHTRVLEAVGPKKHSITQKRIESALWSMFPFCPFSVFAIILYIYNVGNRSIFKKSARRRRTIRCGGARFSFTQFYLSFPHAYATIKRNFFAEINYAQTSDRFEHPVLPLRCRGSHRGLVRAKSLFCPRSHARRRHLRRGNVCRAQ